jgi:hypothetical protein
MSNIQLINKKLIEVIQMKFNRTDMQMVTGDSETINISVFDGNTQIILDTGDTVYFSVKVNSRQDGYIIQKIITTFTEGNAVIEIEPADTSSLFAGTYLYDIQLTQTDGTVSTVVQPSKLVLIKGVTDE